MVIIPSLLFLILNKAHMIEAETFTLLCLGSASSPSVGLITWKFLLS
ncbi:hypothetical protein GLYMA_19G079150v4 [Glycine max]|nr:hypothetical protein GLYMA_19G079150v4 [Glycine max]KAH1076844.1 hypothetical protein GYH30_052380 [Glycine max]